MKTVNTISILTVQYRHTRRNYSDLSTLFTGRRRKQINIGFYILF